MLTSGGREDLQPVAHLICEERGLEFVQHQGEGSFKQVFQVRDTEGEVLALKVLKAGAASSRTEREIEAMQRCAHPNIVALKAVSRIRVEQVAYDYVLETFVQGGTLGDRLRREGPLGRAEIAPLGHAMIDVLAHLHSLRLVHRDIKPDNVMLAEDGSTPVLVDFGIVRDLSASSLTHTWANRGPATPYFAAPEQLNNDKHLIDWRTDQFSLGVMLTYAAFGVHPFECEGEAPDSTVARVANRGEHSRQFLELADGNGLLCLSEMTQVWPVWRYRLPQELAAVWDSTTGG